MSVLDPYIYDSQFLFLNEDEKLENAFINSVLPGTTLYTNGNAKAYFKKENWDSESFHKNFGRLVWLQDQANDLFYNSIKKELAQFDCTYIRLNKEHAFCSWAEKNTLAVLSSKVSQHIDLASQELNFNANYTYTDWTISDHEKNNTILKQVLELSATSFTYNRFKADEHFTPGMIEKIYGNWVQNEFLSGNSKLYLVLVEDKVASFFLYRENISPLAEFKTGFVSLIASSTAFKEKQYASSLLNYVLHKAKENGTAFVIANTESKNMAALNFFKKNNFKETSYLNEYHLWN